MDHELTWAEQVLADYDHKYNLRREMYNRGHFMSNLADALGAADSTNALRILTTWQAELERMYPLTEGAHA